MLSLLRCASSPTGRPHFEQRLTFARARDAVRGNKPFQRLVVAFFLNSLANGFPITLFLLFVQHNLRADDTMLSWILGAYFVMALVSVPFWLLLTKRYGKHRVWVGAMILVCAFFVWVPFLGEGDAWWLLVISLFTGFGLGADLVLPPAMQADVVDLDELRHGEKRTGIFFAVWSIAVKLSLALAAGIGFSDSRIGRLPACRWRQPARRPSDPRDPLFDRASDLQTGSNLPDVGLSSNSRETGPDQTPYRGSRSASCCPIH